MGQSGKTGRAMRALAGAVLAAVAGFLVPSGARAEAPSQLRLCLDDTTPQPQRASACTSVITIAPPTAARELARIYLIRGNAYLAVSDYDRALMDFDAATKADPTAHGPFNSRGLEFRRQKQLDRAITEFDQAIRLNPKDAIPFTNRGDSYRDKGRFDRALEDYDAAIAINPKSVNAHFGRALALQQKSTSDFDAFLNEGRFEQLAVAEYDSVLQLAPRHAGALNNRGQLQNTLRKYGLAIADFTQAIEISPANPLFLRNRALTYRMLRRFDLAIADYRNALALTQDADGRKLIAELLAQLGAAV
jgi:tetratricopeptide (TPR) repeat protein